MLYEVTASRSIGSNDYEIEALLDAPNPLRAAQTFARDMLLIGTWVPDTISVWRLGEPDCHIHVFRLECNILRPDSPKGRVGVQD